MSDARSRVMVWIAGRLPETATYDLLDYVERQEQRIDQLTQYAQRCLDEGELPLALEEDGNALMRMVDEATGEQP